MTDDPARQIVPCDRLQIARRLYRAFAAHDATALLNLRPVPVEYLPVADDRVVVLSRYEGTARGTGRPPSAAFARVPRIADGRVCKLVQITHTARWNDALGASGHDEAQTPGWHR